MEKSLGLGLEWTSDWEGGTWPLWKSPWALGWSGLLIGKVGPGPMWKSPWALGWSGLLIGKVGPGPCGKVPGPWAGVSVVSACGPHLAITKIVPSLPNSLVAAIWRPKDAPPHVIS